MIVCTFAGMLLLIVPVGFLLTDRISLHAANYSPVFWGLAFVAGFVLRRSINSNSARWVWLGGIAWFLWEAFLMRPGYAPRSFLGYSRTEYFW